MDNIMTMKFISKEFWIEPGGDHKNIYFATVPSVLENKSIYVQSCAQKC